MSILDKYGRSFKSLRVSLTNTCNLACVYCVSPKNNTESKETVLEYGALANAVHKIHEATNLKTIRLTGGEPTLYKYLIPFIKKISIPGVEIKMTSNGTLLKNLLPELAETSLKKINISLDATAQDS